MAFISKQNTYEKCAFCQHQALYLKDEHLLLCKAHGMSKFETIFNKPLKTPEDKKYIKTSLQDICDILKKIN